MSYINLVAQKWRKVISKYRQNDSALQEDISPPVHFGGAEFIPTRRPKETKLRYSTYEALNFCHNLKTGPNALSLSPNAQRSQGANVHQ